MKANDLKPGVAITLDGRLFVVVKTEHVKPGKGPAYAALKLKDMMSGANIEKRLGSTDNVEAANLDRRKSEFLYKDSSGFIFMDSDTFDQFTLDADALKDTEQYLVSNLEILIQFYEGRPVNIELPGSVEMKVTETTPGIKGATVTNQLKEATLETGMKTKVPPFINEGEMIRISTSSGEYLSRA